MVTDKVAMDVGIHSYRYGSERAQLEPMTLSLLQVVLPDTDQ